MKAFPRFLGKELLEIARTWRLPVVAGAALFFALTGPVLANLTPELLKSMTTSTPGMIIQLPEPTYVDAYAQWIKNLAQIVAFVIVIASAGAIAGEVAAGTTALVLTKPVSRAGFVVAKYVAQTVLVTVTAVIGTALTQLVTLIVFGEAPPEKLWLSAGIWIAYAALLVAIVTLCSAALPTLAAAGVGVVAMFALSLAALWGPLLRYSPAGLTAAPSDVLLGKDVSLLWPLLTTAGLAVVLVAAASLVFSRREL